MFEKMRNALFGKPAEAPKPKPVERKPTPPTEGYETIPEPPEPLPGIMEAVPKTEAEIRADAAESKQRAEVAKKAAEENKARLQKEATEREEHMKESLDERFALLGINLKESTEPVTPSAPAGPELKPYTKSETTKRMEEEKRQAKLRPKKEPEDLYPPNWGPM